MDLGDPSALTLEQLDSHSNFGGMSLLWGLGLLIMIGLAWRKSRIVR